MRTCLVWKGGESARGTGREKKRNRDLAQICTCLLLIAHHTSPASVSTDQAPAAVTAATLTGVVAGVVVAKVVTVVVVEVEEGVALQVAVNAADLRKEKACGGM